VWWSFPISSALSAFMAFLYYRFGNWKSAHLRPVAAAAGG